MTAGAREFSASMSASSTAEKDPPIRRRGSSPRRPHVSIHDGTQIAVLGARCPGAFGEPLPARALGREAMSWIVILGIVVIVIALVALTGIKGKGTRQVGNTHLMS